MRSHRLNINNYDLSSVIEVEPQSEVVGFTIVSASSGPKTPILINNLTELRNTFGKASSAYPELYEVEQFVGSGYSCFVGNSNSGENDKVPVIVVTNSGYYLAKTKVVDSNITSTSEGLSLEKVYKYIPYEVISSGNSVKLKLDFTDGSSYFPSLAAGKLIRYGVVNNSLISDKKNTDGFSVPRAFYETSEIAGLFNALDIQDPNFAANNSFYYEMTSGIPSTDKIISYIVPKYASTFDCEKLEISSYADTKIDSATNTDRRNVVSITATKYENQSAYIVCNSLVGSFTYNNAVSKFDEINTDFVAQKGINIISHNNASFDNPYFYKGLESVVLVMGSSSVTPNSDKDWSVAEDSIYDDVDLFFDPTYNNNTNSGFFGLHKTHNLAGCIFNRTYEKGGTLPNQLTHGSNYWNICGKVRVNIGKEYIDSSCVGAYALIIANGLRDYNGGIAPMFTTGVLGSLNVSASNVCYRYTKDELKELDKKNFNPVVFDNTYGLMVTSQKTCKAGALTDWSYIGHVAAFLNFEKEVYNQVMIPQIGKPNNPYYRELRKQQVEHLLEERLVTNRIWAEAIVDTSTADGVNDAASRKARKFVIVVKVKVDIFSEYVTLNFYNVDQDTSLSVAQ